MRDEYPAVTAAGGDVVAIGTGDARYAKAFVDDERIPFPVLVDDDGHAARAASVRKVGPAALLFDPRALRGGRRAYKSGYRIKKSGKRVTQLGATFVVGPGDAVRYEHLDAHTADHAPMDEVLAALG